MNSPRTVRGTFVLIIVSLALNLVLAAALVRARRIPVVADGSVTASTNSPSLPLWKRAREQAVVTYVTNTPSSSTLHWTDLESSDYRQYAARLRAAGVPEQVVSDIIVADIGKIFGARIRAVLGTNQVGKFWQHSRQPEFSADQNVQLKALDEERQIALQEVLGREISSQSVVDLLFLQAPRDVALTAFLSEDKREDARATIARADQQVDWLDRQDYTKQQREQERLRLAELEKILTPEELDDYKLRSSPNANAVRGSLRDFQISPEEFRALVAMRDALDKEFGKRGDSQQRQKREAEEMSRALGPERAAEYVRGTDLAWVNARQIAERDGLNLDVADKVYALKQSTDTALEKIRTDQALDGAQRQAQIAAVKASAEQNARATLGDAAFNRYKGRGGMWIGNIR